MSNVQTQTQSTNGAADDTGATYEDMDLLRFSTAGSVDDGKSTLIGRLLYDTKAIFKDRYEQIKQASDRRGLSEVDLALLTDGLSAEREQGITIDVAYRYFATPKRKFIIADTPGHEQYTRNTVTGSSTVEMIVVLVDARNGVLTQTRRHGFIASLLQIPHIVLAVNKMDLVDYSEEVFSEIQNEFRTFSEKLDIDDVSVVPISALKGDNVVEKGDNMPWYDGSTLLHHLENVKVDATRNTVDFRFPVQHVIRPDQNFRGYAGEVASGSVAVGEPITVLPSGKQAHVEKLQSFEEEHERAEVGDAVVLSIDDEIDISRGDMIVRSRNVPQTESQLDADLCWMSEDAMQTNKRYLIQHTTRTVQAFVTNVVYRTNVETMHREAADTFTLNDVGRVESETAEPLFFDPYKINRKTGSFIVIDPDTNNTVGAGMIRGKAQGVTPVGEEPTEEEEKTAIQTKSPNVVWEGLNIEREEREARNGHEATVVWLTGLSGAGKSSIGRKLERKLFDEGCQTMLLDGDNVRHGLSSDLGFSPDDRAENNRRVGEMARLFFEQGSIVICTFVSPYRKDRDFVRSLLPEDRFLEVHVDADVETCKERDPKGLYEKAERGEITNFTGVSAPYEPPSEPELVLRTDDEDVEASVDRLAALLEERGVV
ncbi:MAG: bifunctional sulfate adenylyltransferase subunit 1/adenylylsulfate kinase [Bacteroidetes bacterium QS_8_64_10]|nr:MAG: bifunctional sulfate adenylyltransferase subunit 1/adenylylsulfate kinase [Bacteroidetes bacterium QS_8_64_10]